MRSDGSHRLRSFPAPHIWHLRRMTQQSWFTLVCEDFCRRAYNCTPHIVAWTCFAECKAKEEYKHTPALDRVLVMAERYFMTVNTE
ncbi:hypothetical protein Y1Q_0017793 [Alligator mississippiensis]|uniref:Uncharacterized protein n=1 Tax=Alligator mississippiensis TaxID=8496 RepID=A0A151MJI4_ALLMI|nr:hypothetical protein Y1Q_0017793 [Alligator mississippiensis]